MRTAIAAAVSLLTLLACIAAPAGAKPSPPPAPQQDSVMGSALLDQPDLPNYATGIIVNATSDASGANPSGSVSVSSCCTTPPGQQNELGGPVTCVNISGGNHATIGVYGPVMAAPPYIGPGVFRLLGVVGLTDRGPGEADAFGYSVYRVLVAPGGDQFPPPITDCSYPIPLHYYDMESVFRNSAIPTTSPVPGWLQDFVVHDAPNVPTAKSQCMSGGWGQFGSMFNNQGQCIAYVERGPKPTT